MQEDYSFGACAPHALHLLFATAQKVSNTLAGSATLAAAGEIETFALQMQGHDGIGHLERVVEDHLKSISPQQAMQPIQKHAAQLPALQDVDAKEGGDDTID